MNRRSRRAAAARAGLHNVHCRRCVYALFWLVVLSIARAGAHADSTAASTFVRSDSNSTFVVSPHVQIDKTDGGSELSASYAADVWTSASIDIRASASLPVTEQRDELNLGLSQALGDYQLSAGYRYSTENDYISHGGSAALRWDLAQNNATLLLSGGFFYDQVGRAGAPRFSRRLWTTNARLSYTQVLAEGTLAQVTYELGVLNGYQASPYRFVGLGGDGFGCRDAELCLPEQVPAQRMRHALAARGQQALGPDLSLELAYRIYWDDWGMLSHTASGQVRWMVADDSMLAADYRFYLQGAADFYQQSYPLSAALGGFLTRDRELAPMQDQRIGLEFEQRLYWADAHAMVLSLMTGLTLFRYQHFTGLSRVTAADLTLGIAVQL